MRVFYKKRASLPQKKWRAFSTLLILFSLLGSAQWSHAVETYTPQQGNPLAEPWRWRTMPELENQIVFCMAEGADGSIWFGVEDGVLRYDGLRWTAFNSDTGDMVGKVRSLCASSDGRMYAATDHSIHFFKDETWTKLPLGVVIQKLYPSADGVWMSTHFGAIHWTDDDVTLYTTETAGAPIEGAFPETTTVHFFPAARFENPMFSVLSILEERSGIVWLVVDKKAVRFDPRQSLTNPANYSVYDQDQIGLRLRRSQKLVEGKDGEILICSSAGIRRYDGASKRWKPWPVPEQPDDFLQPVSLLQCADGNWVVSLVDWIYMQVDGTWRRARQLSLEPSQPILLEASDGALWIGKMAGKIFRVDRTDRQWRSYDGLMFQCTDLAGMDWFLAQDGGVVCKNGTQWLHYGEADGLMDRPDLLFCSQEGTVWAAGDHKNAVATAHWSGSRWIRTIHPKLSGSLNHPTVTERQDGSLVFANWLPREENRYSGGLIYAKPSTDGGWSYTYWVPRIAVARTLSTVAEQADGSLILGGSRLWRLAEEGVEDLPAPKGTSTSRIDVMKKDPQDRIWMAVRGGGLFVEDDSQWTHYSAKDGLGGMRISDLNCATDGTVWAAMMDGISRYDGVQWVSDVFGGDFPGFSLDFGSMAADAEGALWFNYADWEKSLLDSGLVNRQEEEVFSFKTIRYQEGISLPETTISVSSERVSPPGNVFFEWQGTSVSESTPRSELHYSWRLNHGEWSPFSRETSHLFLTLDAGDYRFEVRARDQHFNLDHTPARVEFMVLLPVWRQGWFLTMIFFFVGGLAALGYFLIRANNRNQQFAVEHQRQLTEMEQVKLRFFTSISHELRTPLTVMLGPLQSVYEMLESPELKERLRMVLRNGQKLRALVDQILNFRKLEAGKMPIEWAKGDLVQYIQTLAETMEPLAESQNIVYTVQVPNEACMAWFDPDKLHKICGNLVSNAIKYTPAEGHVTVSLSMLQATPGKRFRFCVEDTGKGIPEEAQQHIFEPYYRADSAGSGTGLGLLLAKEWADLLGGTLSLVSPLFNDKAVPYGSRFTVELPLKEEPPEGADAEALISPFEIVDMVLTNNETPSVVLSENADLPTLLVIDDSADIRQFIRSELEGMFTIIEAENGEAGLERAKDALPDFVISDVMMPLMGGIEFCRQLKASPETSHIPVILLTARTAQEFELKGLDVGADDYVTKPFAMPILKARIRGILETRRALRERFSQKMQQDSFDVSNEPVDQVFMTQALEIIENQLSDFEFGVEQFAQALGISSRALRYKLKAVTDLTPATLIRTVRLKRAKELLATSNQSANVSEIAEAVGFLEISYFGRVFKKQFGKTPSEVLQGK